MNSRFSALLGRIFCGLFALCLILLLSFILTGAYSRALAVIMATLSWLVALGGIFWLIRRYADRLEKRRYLILGITLAVMFGLQLFCGIQLETNPRFDFDALFRGAQVWADTGSLGEYQQYFSLFPNNRGGLLLLKNLFLVASWLGITHHYFLGTIFNILLLDLSFFMVFIAADRLMGSRAALFSLALSALCVPLYFYAPIFYTDTLSLPFVAITLALYALGREQGATLRRRLLCFGGMGLALAVGASIKGSAAIIGIAVVIDLLLTRSLKSIILPVAVMAAVMALYMGIMNAYLYAAVLDADMTRRQEVPWTHWVMMGMKGVGTYNPEDYEYTYSFTDPDERKTANLREIGNRLQAYGPGGYLAFLGRKGAYIFSNGTYRVYDFIDNNPQRETVLHEFGLREGRYFAVFDTVCHGLHLSLLVLMLCAALGAWPERLKKGFGAWAGWPPGSGEGSEDSRYTLAPLITVLGMIIFLLLWEANPRYMVNTLPVFFVGASMGSAMLFSSGALQVKSLAPRQSQVSHAENTAGARLESLAGEDAERRVTGGYEAAVPLQRYDQEVGEIRLARPAQAPTHADEKTTDRKAPLPAVPKPPSTRASARQLTGGPSRSNPAARTKATPAQAPEPSPRTPRKANEPLHGRGRRPHDRTKTHL